MPDTFHLEVADHVAHLKLNRPETRNSMPARFWRELPETVRELDAQGAVRALVISAEGPTFSSGMDLSVFAGGLHGTESHDAPARNEAFRHLVKSLQDTFSSLAKARFPVIAAVQGGCIGAGVDLVSACDIRYAADDAFFVIQEINIGMVADVGTFPRLCKLVPDGWVRELAYTGRRLPAAKAKEIGLVNETFATQEALVGAALACAAEIAARDPLAVTGSKAIIEYARDHSVDDALDRIALWQSGMFAPARMAEAFAANQQKRPATFPDLAPLRDRL